MDTYAPSSGQTVSPLVPVLLSQDGPPDVVAVTAWHLAVSNLVGVEVPHDLLGLWLFPARGGAMLLAPAELARDRVHVDHPGPRLPQDQLFALEERVRRAGYASALAIPIRSPSRDIGLALFAHLEAGRLGPAEAVRLHAVVRQLQSTFFALAEAPPLSLAAGPPIDVTAQTALEAVARAVAEGRTAAEVIRLVGGALHTVLPHETIEVAVPGAEPDGWDLLSHAPAERSGESPLVASLATAALVGRATDDGTVLVPDLRTEDLAWPTYGTSRSTRRVRSVAGVRLSVAGCRDAWLLVGGQPPGFFRTVDLDLLRTIAPVVASRVQGLRALDDPEAVRREGGPAVTRSVTALAVTRDWGEALEAFVQDVRQSLGYARVRFVLRAGEQHVVEQEQPDPGVIGAQATFPLAGHRVESLFTGGVSHAVGAAPDADLAVPMRIGGTVVGVMELLGGRKHPDRHAIRGAQLFADLVAPHLELVRRGESAPAAWT